MDWRIEVRDSVLSQVEVGLVQAMRGRLRQLAQAAFQGVCIGVRVCVCVCVCVVRQRLVS